MKQKQMWEMSFAEHVTMFVKMERERCAEIAEAEPECPGPMPDELRLVPLEDAIRAAVIATKKSIASAIRDNGQPKQEAA